MNSPIKALPTVALTESAVDALCNPQPSDGWSVAEAKPCIWDESPPDPAPYEPPPKAIETLTLYTVEDRRPPGDGRPQLKVVPFQIEFGRITSRFKTTAYPELVFKTNDDAQEYLRTEVRKQIHQMWAAPMIEMLTVAGLEQGMLEDAELNLADALRRYMQESK